MSSNLSTNFKQEKTIDSIKFKSQNNTWIVSIYLNNLDNWIELSKKSIVRGTGGYIQVLGHLSATNDRSLSHLWMGNLQDIPSGEPIIKSIQARGLNPIMAFVAHEQKKGTPKGFGFIYVKREEANEIINLAPPLIYRGKQIKISDSIRSKKKND